MSILSSLHILKRRSIECFQLTSASIWATIWVTYQNELFLEQLGELEEARDIAVERDQVADLFAELLGEVPVLQLVMLFPLPENVVKYVAVGWKRKVELSSSCGDGSLR